MNELTSLPSEFTHFLAIPNASLDPITALINSTNVDQLKNWQRILMAQSLTAPGSRAEEVVRRNNESFNPSFWSDFAEPVFLSASLGGLGGSIVGIVKGNGAVQAAKKGCFAGLTLGCFWGGYNVNKNFKRSVTYLGEAINAKQEDMQTKQFNQLLMLIQNRIVECSVGKKDNDSSLRRRNALRS